MLEGELLAYGPDAPHAHEAADTRGAHRGAAAGKKVDADDPEAVVAPELRESPHRPGALRAEAEI